YSLDLFPCLVRRLPCHFGFRRGVASFPARPFWSEAVLRGLFAVQDRPAGTANGDAMFDFFGADRALGHRLGIVQPGLFDAELTRGASFEVRDEHGILRALPFEVGGRHQAALKFLELPARAGEFRIGRLSAGGNENAVETSLPRVAVRSEERRVGKAVRARWWA